MSSSPSSLELYGTFPPVTPNDWRNMFFESPLPINRDASQMVYDVCWFLVKDQAEAMRLTVVTFRIAVSRFNPPTNGLPAPAAYSAWLASIASNEAHRLLDDAPTRRMSSPLLESGPDREAFYLADTLAEMRADYKLALLLRYRYDVPPVYLSQALDLRPRSLARLFVKAREEFSKNSSYPPSALAQVHPPRSIQLPQIVEPYAPKDMRPHVLGYDWLESDFPIIPERDERRTKWVTLVVTAVLLVVLAVAATRTWSAERPTLIDPANAVETVDE